MKGVEIKIQKPNGAGRFDSLHSFEDATVRQFFFFLWHLFRNKPDRFGNDITFRYEITLRR